MSIRKSARKSSRSKCF